MTEFYQIYFEDHQKESLFPFAIPYYNQGLTVFFENSVIANLVTGSKADKVSVCSWKLKEKLKWYVGRPRELTLELLESDFDVMSFTKNSHHHKMLDCAEIWHKGFKDTLKKIVTGIGKPMPLEVKNAIYQNHFCAKREIYQFYVITYLLPAMELIINDPDINRLAMEDSGYSNLSKAKASSEYLRNRLGVPFYPMAPFLLERLFSVFVHNEKINVSYL